MRVVNLKQLTTLCWAGNALFFADKVKVSISIAVYVGGYER